MIPRDTSAKAHAAQIEAYRRMTEGESIEIALELSDMVRGLALDSIRAAHPEWTDRQVHLQVVREIYPELNLPDANSSV
jgi:hypothetical protein